jgi:hypothetical protein
MGTTADKIAKAILAQERSVVIDLSSYRAGKAAIEDARLGDGRLRELLTRGYDPAHAAFVFIAGVPDDRQSLPHGRLMRTTSS